MSGYVTRQPNLEDTQERLESLEVATSSILSSLQNRRREATRQVRLGVYGIASTLLLTPVTLAISDQPYWIVLGFFFFVALVFSCAGLATRHTAEALLQEAEKCLRECGFNTDWTSGDPTGRMYARLKYRWFPAEKLQA